MKVGFPGTWGLEPPSETQGGESCPQPSHEPSTPEPAPIIIKLKPKIQGQEMLMRYTKPPSSLPGEVVHPVSIAPGKGGGGGMLKAQVAQAPKEAINMTFHNSVVFVRLCMGM